MRIYKYVALLFLLGFLLSGCNKDDNVIKIGAILPLTGNAADYGVKTKKGIDLAAEQLNENNGINGKKIRVIYEDDRLKPKLGVNALLNLITQHDVQSILGPISSGVVLNIAPIANKNKRVILSTYASNYKITEAGDYIFRIYPSDAFQGKKDAEYAYENGYHKAAILYIQSDYGIGLKEVFNTNFKRIGGTIIIEESFKQGDKNFRTQLQKIKNSNADIVFMPGNAKEMAQILKQAKELGINKQFLSTDSFLESTILDIAKNAANGVIFSVPKIKDKENYKVFSKSYEEKYNSQPGILEALGYDGLRILAETIKNSGKDAKDIKKGLYNIHNYEGVTGTIDFDSNGDIQKEFIMKKVKNGKFVNLK